MAYPQETAAVGKSSIIDDATKANERLREIHARISKLGDLLHGSEPKDVGGPATPEPAPSMRRSLDLQSNLIGRIENELGRVENRL